MSATLARTIDGNEAVASVAYRLNEVIGIYPITPASPMGEACDEWAARGKTNLWGLVPKVVEMQSEGGAAGAVHGALQAGALATTFTASQGLLLMVPNLYKIAGELLPCVIHVAARSLATHALSIFCDHSDVMACRQTGFALLASTTGQQAHDFACIAQAATLRSRVPFLHFFDGFRTSHELTLVHELRDDDLRALIDDSRIAERRRAALSPDHPSVRGVAQNPDTFFQAREAANRFYQACPEIVLEEMQRFAERTGRRYQLFEYTGHPEAERVIIAMGSAAVTVAETVRALCQKGERVGALSVALYRPFAVEHFLRSLPRTAARLAVLDRTKEPGGVGEPLYLDVVAALAEGERGSATQVIGGRYGLSSKELTPAMVERVFTELASAAPRRHFSLGIVDDVTLESLDVPAEVELARDGSYEAIFFGLGSDGTVGANKNTIKIVGDRGDFSVQGFFVYDSKKSGAVTVSHLRFARQPIARPYLITRADFVACHQYELLDRMPVLESVRDGGVLLLNSPFGPSATWQNLSREAQQAIIDKRARLYVIDGYRVATEAGLGRHINTVMQVCFFALSGLIPFGEALSAVRASIVDGYAEKGADIVARNLAAVAAARASLAEVSVPDAASEVAHARAPAVPASAPEFVQRVTAVMLAGQGDRLPVSAFPVDGTWPTGTSRFEKRRLAEAIPVWDEGLCIQCNKCVLACPHAAIRAKVYPGAELARAPAGFQATAWKGSDLPGERYTLAVAPEDCTGCRLCVEVCPAKDKTDPRHRALEMQPLPPLLGTARERYDFFLGIPSVDRRHVHLDVKGSQLLDPLFEYSGACAGCGETPYLKLLTQLFGDRLMVANATGCSSIYGGNLPTTPYAVGADGRGPAWANSLFEDNAEFGLGMRLALDAHRARAESLLRGLSGQVDAKLVAALLDADQTSDAGIHDQRKRVSELRLALRHLNDPSVNGLLDLSDYLVKKSLWIVGGDGWAYDIGFGGLDHVLASQENVNVLVLDTEVYSNTGGQRSKATPRAAAAKFATLGKETGKKDLGLHAMSYGHVYVARVAFGAKDAQTVRAFVEAEAYPGPSLVIAYSPCIAHGYDLASGARQQKLAVDSGVWPLFRFDPRRLTNGEPPLVLDAIPGKAKLGEYLQGEARFNAVERLDPPRYEWLLAQAQRDVSRRIELYQALSQLKFSATRQVLADVRNSADQ
jgi:pyruvate-ferredoxin/flavodoxin oxidoreductase